MLLMHNVSVEVTGTGYVVEYAITSNEDEEESEGVTEYGIQCNLYRAEAEVASEKVMGVTTELGRIKKILHILLRNRVFPAHVRDVIEDLLILEFEEGDKAIFCPA